MKIYLPNSAFLGNIDPFIRGFDASHPSQLDITANKQWISIHPVVLCMVASLGKELRTEQVHLERLEAKSKHYLKRMGLFSLLHIKEDMRMTEHEPAGRFIPVTQITNSTQLTRVITDMVPLLHLEPDQADSIKYVVSELVRNVLEHARTEEGAFVAAQYYKKSNTVRIGVVDRGIGIKQTINVSHFAPTHLEAIRLALTPGITGATRREGGNEQNAGAGLFFIKSLAQVNREFFMIYSGNSLYKLLKDKPEKVRLHADPFKDRHSIGEDFPEWRGTVVGVDISLEKTQAFSALLDQIHGIYIATIKERKKEKYRRPKFI